MRRQHRSGGRRDPRAVLDARQRRALAGLDPRLGAVRGGVRRRHRLPADGLPPLRALGRNSLDAGAYFRPDQPAAAGRPGAVDRTGPPSRPAPADAGSAGEAATALVGGQFARGDADPDVDPDRFDESMDVDWAAEAVERAAAVTDRFGPETRLRRGWSSSPASRDTASSTRPRPVGSSPNSPVTGPRRRSTSPGSDSTGSTPTGPTPSGTRRDRRPRRHRVPRSSPCRRSLVALLSLSPLDALSTLGRSPAVPSRRVVPLRRVRTGLPNPLVRHRSAASQRFSSRLRYPPSMSVTRLDVAPSFQRRVLRGRRPGR